MAGGYMDAFTSSYMAGNQQQHEQAMDIARQHLAEVGLNEALQQGEFARGPEFDLRKEALALSQRHADATQANALAANNAVRRENFARNVTGLIQQGYPQSWADRTVRGWLGNPEDWQDDATGRTGPGAGTGAPLSAGQPPTATQANLPPSSLSQVASSAVQGSNDAATAPGVSPMSPGPYAPGEAPVSGSPSAGGSPLLMLPSLFSNTIPSDGGSPGAPAAPNALPVPTRIAPQLTPGMFGLPAAGGSPIGATNPITGNSAQGGQPDYANQPAPLVAALMGYREAQGNAATSRAATAQQAAETAQQAMEARRADLQARAGMRDWQKGFRERTLGLQQQKLDVMQKLGQERIDVTKLQGTQRNALAWKKLDGQQQMTVMRQSKRLEDQRDDLHQEAAGLDRYASKLRMQLAQTQADAQDPLQDAGSTAIMQAAIGDELSRVSRARKQLEAQSAHISALLYALPNTSFGDSKTKQQAVDTANARAGIGPGLAAGADRKSRVRQKHPALFGP